MNITVVGAGNMGLAIAAYLSIKGNNNIILYTSKVVSKSIKLIDVEANTEYETNKYTVTASKEKAFSFGAVVLCTYPAFLRKKFIEDNIQYLLNVDTIIFVPGYGGIEYSCKKLMEQGVNIVGLQRVPYVARSKAGPINTEACILSKKQNLYVASIPKSNTKTAKELVNKLFDIPTIALKEYLAVTLVPSNPLLHLTGLYNLFAKYENGIYYDREYSFYKEWNDTASEMLIKYDEELQKICYELTPFNLDEVVSLKIYYESDTKEKMTKKLQSIEAFKCVKAPMIKTENGFIPDFSSRMFVEDFPYGICIIKAFALMTHVDTPIIDEILRFYYDMTGIIYFDENGEFTKEAINTGIPMVNGISDKKELIEFYNYEH